MKITLTLLSLFINIGFAIISIITIFSTKDIGLLQWNFGITSLITLNSIALLLWIDE